MQNNSYPAVSFSTTGAIAGTPFGGSSTNRSRPFVVFARFLALLVLSMLPILAHAEHDQAPISDFDYTGMGTFSGTYVQSATDHPWFIFNANAGNTITIAVNTSYTGGFSPGSHTWLYRAPDGCAEIGDFSGNNTLTLLQQAGSGSNSYTLTYTVPTTGQFAVQLDSWNGGDGTYTVTLAGSTAATVLCSTLIPTLATSPITPSTFCPGASVSVPFTATGPYDAGNTFTAQLSGPTGSFATPTPIGSAAGTASGAISATIPASTIAGTGYRIRVVSSSPELSGSDNGGDLTVGSVPSPTVTVLPANSTNTGGVPTTLYLGYGPQSVTLAASGGGANETYSWVAAAGSPPLSNSSIANPVFTATTAGTYTYTVTITSAAGCTASTSVTLTVVNAACGNKNDKVLVCHKGNTLCISAAAVNDHLLHGDQVGTCSTTAGWTAAAGSLYQLAAYPNPVATQATVSFRTPLNGQAQVKIYNLKGQRVATLYEGKVNAGQLYEFSFDGQTLAPGLYQCQLVVNGQIETLRLLLAR